FPSSDGLRTVLSFSICAVSMTRRCSLEISPPSRKLAMPWLDRLARREKAVVDVAARMAAAYEAAGRNDYATALKIWGPLAHAGVARAQNNVGACFSEGLGVWCDQALALRWLTLAAEAGDPVGQRNLAAVYFKGAGVEQDYTRAAELY